MNPHRPTIYEGPVTSIYLARGNNVLYSGHTGCEDSGMWDGDRWKCMVCNAEHPPKEQMKHLEMADTVGLKDTSLAVRYWISQVLGVALSAVRVDIEWD